MLLAIEVRWARTELAGARHWVLKRTFCHLDVPIFIKVHYKAIPVRLLRVGRTRAASRPLTTQAYLAARSPLQHHELAIILPPFAIILAMVLPLYADVADFHRHGTFNANESQCIPLPLESFLCDQLACTSPTARHADTQIVSEAARRTCCYILHDARHAHGH